MSSSRLVATSNRTITIGENGPFRRLIESCRIEVAASWEFPRFDRKGKKSAPRAQQARSRRLCLGSSEEAVQTARVIGYPGGLGSSIRRER